MEPEEMNEEISREVEADFMAAATELTAHCLNKSASMKQQLASENSAAIARAVVPMIRALRSGGKVLVCGNGGSAADAQHFAAELVGRFLLDRPGLAAIALTTNPSNVTSIGNDFGFEQIFSRQVEALARPEDVVVGISTSGNSANVLEALTLAHGLGCATVGLAGNDGGALVGLCDECVIVPTKDTPLIQECHIAIIHIWCDLIEQTLFDTNAGEADDDLLDDAGDTDDDDDADTDTDDADKA